ncbi:MAG: RNA polymerase sigma factor [Acidobacteriales bacterium]|nr:RNA polymerase sigma factor [Terriglobales bacterium]
MHKRRVYSLCLRMLGNTAEAEDLAQEAFLQLFRKISMFRGESAFSTWLHRLTVNVVLMHLRKKGLNQVSLDEYLEPQEDDGPRRDVGLPDNVLAGSVDRVTLERCVEELPPGYKVFFVLHDVEGYEHNEIADMVGCSIGNSKSQLHKARMKLRDRLKTGRWAAAAAAIVIAFSVYQYTGKTVVAPVTNEAVVDIEPEDAQVLAEVERRAPDSKAVYEKNLKQVNASIHEAKRLVKERPGDRDAQGYLRDAYAQKAQIYDKATTRSLE